MTGLVQATSKTKGDIQRMKTHLETVTGQVNNLIAKGNLAATDADWKGGDRDSWMRHWEGEVSPALNKIKTDLDTLTTEVENVVDGIIRAGGGMS